VFRGSDTRRFDAVSAPERSNEKLFSPASSTGRIARGSKRALVCREARTRTKKHATMSIGKA